MGMSLDVRSDLARSETRLRIAAAVLAVSTFVVDRFLPLGVAGGIPYVLVVLMGLWSTRRGFVMAAAVTGTLLTLLGAWVSPPGGVFWMAMVNRSVTLLAIWAVAFVLLRHQRAQSELERRRRYTERYLDIAEVAILALDASGRVTLINRKGCEILGRGSAEVVGKNWFDHFIPDRLRDGLLGVYRKLMAGDVVPVRDFENPVLTADGDERIVAWRNTVLRDDDGHVIGTLSSGEDITEHKLVQQRLTQLAAIVESSEDAIIGHTLHGVITSWNPGAERLFGHTAETIVGSPASVLLPPDRPNELDEILQRIGRGMKVESFETVRVRKGGEAIHVQLTVSPIRDSSGQISGASIIARDMTERKRAREELRRSHKALADMKAALDQASIVAITDARGTISYVNDNFCEISGYSRDELLGQDHRIVNSGYHPKEFIRNLWRTIARGEVWRGEIRNRAKDGRLYWVDTTIVPYLDARGKPYQYMAIRGDITDRKKAEEQLRQQEALAKLGQMAAVVAHEVRNPLAGIGGALGIIGERLPPDSPDREVIANILERIDSLNTRVQDLLVFARPRVLRYERIRLRSLLRETTDLLNRDPRLAGVEVRVEGEDLAIAGDAELLKAVFLNLLLNSSHAIGGAGEIGVSVETRDDGCCVTVSDHGPGISEDTLPKIFEPFFTTKSQGTGLGLSIAKRVVEAHRGRISVTCPDDGGTRVVVRLPVDRQETRVTTRNARAERSR
jgi:PAS domain S-box-containing protein